MGKEKSQRVSEGRCIMIVTPVTDLLGISLPIVQGGMQWVGVPPLVSAVSNAGGLGILTALTQPTPDALRKAIRDTRRRTDKPFGVNITLLPTINPPDYDGYVRAAVEEGVRIFETAGNNRSSFAVHFTWHQDSGLMNVRDLA